MITEKLRLPSSFQIKFFSFSQDRDSVLNCKEGREKLRGVGIGTHVDVGEWLVKTFRKRFGQDDLAERLHEFIHTANAIGQTASATSYLSYNMDLSNVTIPLDTPISKLEAGEAFKGLTDREKLYCHYLSRASWEGASICLLQTSPESVPVFLLLREVFSRQSVQSLREAVGDGVSEDEFKAFLLYSCALFSNMGNYKSFGDTKFIPGIDKDKFHSILVSSDLYHSQPDLVERLWTACCDAIFSLNQREKQLGLGEEGISTYYSDNCTAADAEAVQKFMQEKDISPYNTRLFKTVEQDGKVKYELRLASSVTSSDPCDKDDKVASVLGVHSFDSTTILVSRGDYAPLMRRMVENLEKAKEHSSNDHETEMIENYIRSFKTGSIDDHKEGSRHWIKNKGPIVETYIGFIESYQDPFGVRGEFEGFVAVVNKVMSAKFTKLVSSAEGLLPELPWPKEFEKDRFLRPDFTSLDVVTFGSSGIPAGINIPNYDDIRQNEGFKNVSLGNVLSAAYQDKRVSFLVPEEQELFVKLRGPAFEVQVGLHELLGHGSGKLFKQLEDGTFNFDIANVENPVNGGKISTWYGPNDTWDTKFLSVASSYEECRAECVGLYLCLSTDVLSIFGHEGSAGEDVMYVNWLNMVRAGLLGLEYYTPENKKWRQAHMQARYVILRVLLANASGLVSVERTVSSDGNPDIVIRLDRSKIKTAGKKAIGDFLQKLQVFKSTADVASGEALYNHYSKVSDEDGGWLALREIVLARKFPRRMLVQPLTVMEGGDVSLCDFEASPEGIIESMTHYNKKTGYDEELEALWNKDRHFWKV